MASKENLDLLSEEIDIEIFLIGTKCNVGRFHVDMYAEEASTDRKMMIENQLKKLTVII